MNLRRGNGTLNLEIFNLHGILISCFGWCCLYLLGYVGKGSETSKLWYWFYIIWFSSPIANDSNVVSVGQLYKQLFKERSHCVYCVETLTWWGRKRRTGFAKKLTWFSKNVAQLLSIYELNSHWKCSCQSIFKKRQFCPLLCLSFVYRTWNVYWSASILKKTFLGQKSSSLRKCKVCGTFFQTRLFHGRQIFSGKLMGDSCTWVK